jgi:lysozyme
LIAKVSKKLVVRFFSCQMLNVIVDLSHYNDPVNFTQVAQGGLMGVVHKVTQGLTECDPLYTERQPLAQATGLLWGAYHFGTIGDGDTQAQHFLATVQHTSQVLLMLDFEAPAMGAGMSRAEAEAFVEAVHTATGRYPGLYSTCGYLAATTAEHSAVLANCWLWLADYNAGPPPVCPPAWRTWTMWQYTDGRQGNEPRTAPGIGPCDRNMFNGELPGLRALWGLPTTVPAVAC